MMPAEEHEVVETGFTTIGPVNDVVTVHKLMVRAPREAATTISCF
jgi:hypothetical protein